MTRDESFALRCPHGLARVHPIGATVLSWVPAGGRDVLWCSPQARFEEGRAIRGGVPICWPWFARDPAFPEGPSHGLVRTRRWSLEGQESKGDAVCARFALTVDDDPRVPPFRVALDVWVGDHLALTLTHHDLAGAGFSCRGALHAYLAADARRSVVRGLGGARAFDKITQRTTRVTEPLPVTPPMDLVVRTDGPVVLDDGARSVTLSRDDAPDVVVWNPGPGRPSDVPPGGEHQFVCVEAAAVTNPWPVAAGGERRLGMRLRTRASPSSTASRPREVGDEIGGSEDLAVQKVQPSSSQLPLSPPCRAV